MYARSIYSLSHYHCQEAIQNVETLHVLVLYIIRKCCYCKSNGILSPHPGYVEIPTHDISNPLLMVLWSATRGISNPLSMVYWIPYSWHIEPPIKSILTPRLWCIKCLWHFDPLSMLFWSPTHIISTPFPWYAGPLPIVYRTAYPLYYEPLTHVILYPYPWYFDSATHGISKTLLWYYEPPVLVEMRGFNFIMMEFNIQWRKLDSEVEILYGILSCCYHDGVDWNGKLMRNHHAN
jgi:hypothetical protein